MIASSGPPAKQLFTEWRESKTRGKRICQLNEGRPLRSNSLEKHESKIGTWVFEGGKYEIYRLVKSFGTIFRKGEVEGMI